MSKTKCEMWIAINEDGDYVVVENESDALERLAEDHGGYAAKVVKIAAFISPPVIEEHTIDVAETSGTTVQLETE